MSKSQKQSVDTWVRWAAERNLSLTRAEVKEMVDKYNDMISQSVPYSGGARLKPNNTDRMTKGRTDSIYKPSDLNLHDPHEMYAWADERPWWLRPLQVLGFVSTGVGLTLCLYYATVILFLL